MQSSLELGLESLKANDIDKAIEYLEEATNIAPQDFTGFSYLGIAYARKGLYNRAVGAFLVALRLRPNVPSVHFNIGLAYQADGFLPEAKVEFEKALEIDPSYQRASEALKALETQMAEDTLSAQSCMKHTDEPAAALCSWCHLPICEECKTFVDGKVYCPHCAEQVSARR